MTREVWYALTHGDGELLSGYAGFGVGRLLRWQLEAQDNRSATMEREDLFESIGLAPAWLDGYDRKGMEAVTDCGLASLVVVRQGKVRRFVWDGHPSATDGAHRFYTEFISVMSCRCGDFEALFGHEAISYWKRHLEEIPVGAHPQTPLLWCRRTGKLFYRWMEMPQSPDEGADIYLQQISGLRIARREGPATRDEAIGVSGEQAILLSKQLSLLHSGTREFGDLLFDPEAGQLYLFYELPGAPSVLEAVTQVDAQNAPE